MMFDTPLRPGIVLTGVKDDYDVVRVDERDLYLVGWRQPDGRHSGGLDKFDRQLDKGSITTTRNWNTILKALN